MKSIALAGLFMSLAQALIEETEEHSTEREQKIIDSISGFAGLAGDTADMKI